MATEHGREAWLDGLKGFSILLVILGHILSGYLDAWTFPDSYQTFYYIRTWIYSFHMPLFFLISGFTFTLAYYREGTLRRPGFFRQMGSLLWLYVLFGVILWLVKVAVPDAVNDAYTLDDLKNMFLVPLGNFWYIYVLFVFYALAALLRLPRWNPLFWLFFGGLSIAMQDNAFGWLGLTPYRIVYHLSFFFLGCVLCRNRTWLCSQKLLGVSAMFLSAAAFYYILLYTRDWYANWHFLIAVTTSFVFLYEFHRFPKLSGFPLFQLCGKYCLELYLLHTFFTAGLRTLLPRLGLSGGWLNTLLNFLLSTGLSLGIAMLAGKVPALDVIFHPARFFSRIAEPGKQK